MHGPVVDAEAQEMGDGKDRSVGTGEATMNPRAITVMMRASCIPTLAV
jgi:hypothetical protein